MIATKVRGNAEAKVSVGFPIVGLGASAGGLEAFEHFFRSVPRDSGMAFVLVPHLDPGHASILTEILQRSTAMPVVEAQHSMVVTPNSVYVIPPNRDMAIFRGVIQLSTPERPRGHRMPIDSFLRSLAEDQGEKAIGVILSGTGTDGTMGLRSILSAGGVSFVQDPASAKYDGMPSSAIRAGFATYVLPADRMAEVMLTGARTIAVSQQSSANRREQPESYFDSVALRHRPRLLQIQEDHPRPAHRAADVATRHREHGGLCPLSQGASP
jgi:two-component system CheB/CheR fusion protein